MNDQKRVAEACKYLQEIVDRANRLRASAHLIRSNNYHDWSCNIRVQEIFGLESNQYRLIKQLNNTNNAVVAITPNSSISHENKISFLDEILKKSELLQGIIENIQSDQIDDNYLLEVTLEEKVSTIQSLLDEADLALSSGPYVST